MPPIRVLPLTMLALGALLATKSVHVVRAFAESTEAATPAPPAAPKPSAEAMAPPAPAPVPTPAPTAAAAAPEPAPSAAERALLQDLRKRRVELDGREAAIAARETLAAATQAKLSARVDELSALQKQLEGLEAARRDRDEANWRGLVRTYETMKPREAAAIFNDLDMPVLLQVADRMKETKLAPILAAMLPDRARQLTTDLAQLRAHQNAMAANAVPNPVLTTAAAAAPPASPATPR